MTAEDRHRWPTTTLADHNGSGDHNNATFCARPMSRLRVRPNTMPWLMSGTRVTYHLPHVSAENHLPQLPPSPRVWPSISLEPYGDVCQPRSIDASSASLNFKTSKRFQSLQIASYLEHLMSRQSMLSSVIMGDTRRLPSCQELISKRQRLSFHLSP